MAISESFVQGPPDSTGKKIESVEVTTSQGVVERQVIAHGDPVDPSARVAVLNADPAGGAYGAVQRIVGTVPLPTGASTESTLAAIKAKTDNIDVALSTRTKPADQQHVIVDSMPASPTTIADGADSAEGVTTDAAVISDAAGTISAKLRGLIKWAFERMPASLGSKTSASSLPVVIASDQVAVAVTGTVTTSPPANASTNLSQVGGSAISEGQKVMTASLPVVIASDQSAVPVSGTVTANAGTNLNTSALALDATLTGGTAKAIARGGAKGATAAADLTSTAEGADHQALDVQIMHGGAAKDPTAIRALTTADAVTATLAASSAVVGHVIVDTAPTTAVTNAGMSNLDVLLSTRLKPADTLAAVTAITNVVHVDDNAGSLTVDAPVGTPVFSRLSDGAAALIGQKVSASSLPVVLASDQSSIPVAATLQAGAAIVGKVTTDQTTHGTTDLVAADITKVGGAAVVTGTGAGGAGVPRVTVSNDSTVTANAGTNLNTSALALGSQLPSALVGGRLDENVGAWLGSTAPTVGSKASASSIPVVIASDQGAVPVSGTVTTSPPANASENLAQVGGVNISQGQKAMAASLPVVLASDQASIPVAATIQAGAATIGKADQGAAGAAAWPVSVASLPLPANAAQESSGNLDKIVAREILVVDLLKEILKELKAIRTGVSYMACEGGRVDEDDLDPDYTDFTALGPN